MKPSTKAASKGSKKLPGTLMLVAPLIEHPKYAIASLLRDRYGEFNYDKQGIDDLATFCGLNKKQTVKEWMNIRAGESRKINHLVLGKVLVFFSTEELQLQTESQLFTEAHKQLLKQPATA